MSKAWRADRTPARSRQLRFNIGKGIVKTVEWKQLKYRGANGTIKTVGSSANTGQFSTAIQPYRSIKDIDNLPVPMVPFASFVHNIVHNFNPDLKIDRSALHAIRESAEAALVIVFEGANRFAEHANRITLQPKDIKNCLAILEASGALRS